MAQSAGELSNDPFESPLAPQPSVAQRILPRIVFALASGVAVTVTAFLCAWLQLRDAAQFRAPIAHEQHVLRQLQHFIDAHQHHTGSQPIHLSDALQDDNNFRMVDPDRVADYSGAVYLYRATNDGYELVSLGADGRLGGIGLDADLYNDGRYSASPRITLRQFSTAAAIRSVRFSSVIAGLVAFIACLSFNFVDLRRDQPAPRLVLLGEVLVSAAMAAVAALFMSVIHIPSGH
jgi:hypothetical protein